MPMDVDIDKITQESELILISPNGTRWKLVVDDNGVLTTVQVP